MIEIEDIKRLDVRPGDVLVLRVAESLSMELATRLRTMIEAPVSQLGVKCIVLDRGMALDVLAQQSYTIIEAPKITFKGAVAFGVPCPDDGKAV